jgi:hypothetical protein
MEGIIDCKSPTMLEEGVIVTHHVTLGQSCARLQIEKEDPLVDRCLPR